MRTIKSKGGFTLVELIVVIAILAILAGVAIPVYNGYIKKAQDAAAITELDALATAAQAANATAGSIGSIDVTVANGATSIQVNPKQNETLATDYDDNFVLYMGGKVTDKNTANDGAFTATGLKLDGTSFAKGATWDGKEWEGK